MNIEHEAVESAAKQLPTPAEEMSAEERVLYQERIIVKNRIQEQVEDRLGFMTLDNQKGKSLSDAAFNLDHFLWTMNLGGEGTSNAARFDDLYQEIVKEGKITDEDKIVGMITAKLITRDRLTFKDVGGNPEFVALK